MQSMTSDVGVWAFRTPIKPRGGIRSQQTPATFDTEGEAQAEELSAMSIVEPLSVSAAPWSAQRTQDSSSPVARQISGVAETTTRLLDLRREQISHASPTYNTVAPRRICTLRPGEGYGLSSRHLPQYCSKTPGQGEDLCATPQAMSSARRFHFEMHPLDLFESTEASSKSPSSCWVNVSPLHKSVLLYTAGVAGTGTNLGCGVVCGPEASQKLAFAVPMDANSGVEFLAEDAEADSRAGPSVDVKDYVSRKSTLSMMTPKPSRAHTAVQPSFASADRAALQAAVTALKTHRSSWSTLGFSRVVIATDNKYVVSGACDWLDEWRRSKWRLSELAVARTAPRRAADQSPERTVSVPEEGARCVQSITDADLWEELDRALSALRNEGLVVEFLHIPAEWNTQAIAAARRAASVS